MEGSGRNHSTSLPCKPKGQPHGKNKERSRQTRRARVNPQKDWVLWSPFHSPALQEYYKLLCRSASTRGIIAHVMKTPRWSGDTLNTGCSLKVKSNLRVIPSRSPVPSYTDWLVCLVLSFSQGETERRGKYSTTIAVVTAVITGGEHPSFVLSLLFGLISPGTAWFINKHKTISWPNYQQESPGRRRGRARMQGCPQFRTPLCLKSESLSSEFHGWHGHYEMASDHDGWGE